MLNRKKSILFFSLLLTLLLFFGALVLQRKHPQNLKARVARELLLTDLCLTTEARHTRRLSQPDVFTPFQDFPGGLDRFPSSTFLTGLPSAVMPRNVEGGQ